MSDPQHPIPGDLVVDAADGNVIDITPDEVIELTKVRDGFEEAVANVVNLQPDDLDRAGLDEKEVKHLGFAFQKDQRIAELLSAAQKLVELLHETKQSGRQVIGPLLAETAAQARRHAERAPAPRTLRGPLGGHGRHLGAHPGPPRLHPPILRRLGGDRPLPGKAGHPLHRRPDPDTSGEDP